MKSVKEYLESLDFEDRGDFFIRIEEELIVEVLELGEKFLVRLEISNRFDSPTIKYIEVDSGCSLRDVLTEVLLIEDEDYKPDYWAEEAKRNE